jgi:hypothetical protein
MRWLSIIIHVSRATEGSWCSTALKLRSSLRNNYFQRKFIRMRYRLRKLRNRSFDAREIHILCWHTLFEFLAPAFVSSNGYKPRRFPTAYPVQDSALSYIKETMTSHQHVDFIITVFDPGRSLHLSQTLAFPCPSTSILSQIFILSFITVFMSARIVKCFYFLKEWTNLCLGYYNSLLLFQVSPKIPTFL